MRAGVVGTRMIGMPKFVCRCRNDTFRCKACVAGYVDAEVRTAEDEGFEEILVETDDAEAESFAGPFVCTKCGAEYDVIPPEGWTGWEPSELRLTSAQRIALGETPLIPDAAAR